MCYKGILLDLDNTLYDYQRCHKAALSAATEYLSGKLDLDKNSLEIKFSEARSQIHNELACSAASHNRLLYFQRMLEDINPSSIQYALESFNIYWNTFLENIVLFDGVKDFFDLIKDKKVGIITDLTADIQHRKLLSLSMFDDIDCLVTSEEAGCEKPDSGIFRLALKKMNLAHSDVCMIGDDFEKDILGARQLGIKALWLNRQDENKKINDDSIVEFKSFSKITEYFTHVRST